MMEELSANDKEVARLHGTPILYGQTIQLRHNYTKKYLSVSLKSAKTDSNSMRVMISRNITKHSNFRIMPAYKIRTEGEAVRQGDKIVNRRGRGG